MQLVISILLSLCIMICNADEDLDSRIVQGKEVEEGRYPYSVSLTRFGSHICGGSLIAPQYVLTAAHCAKSIRDVQFGRHDRSGNEAYEQIGIMNKIIHPNYDDNNLENDVMILQLNRKVSSEYTPVELDENADFLRDGEVVTVMGWGRIEYGGVISQRQLETDVDVISNEACASIYKQGIIEGSICAYRNGTDACQGDSGGPLIVKGDNATNDVLVGLVSWGRGCALEGYPGVYARVSTYIDWIKGIAQMDVPTASPTAEATFSKLPSIAPTISSLPSISLAPTNSRPPSNFPSLTPSSHVPSITPSFNQTIQPTGARLCFLRRIVNDVTKLFQ